MLLDALEVVAHRVVTGLVLALAGTTQHVLEVQLVVVGPDVTLSVDIEITRHHGRVVIPVGRQLLHQVFGDPRHHDTLMRSMRAPSLGTTPGGGPGGAILLAMVVARAIASLGSLTISSATSRRARAAAISSRAADCRCSTTS